MDASDQDRLNGREGEREEGEQRKCLAQGSGSHHAGHQQQHHVKYFFHTSINIDAQTTKRPSMYVEKN
jgi:hypothetical protein